jgi:hypothetical protein
MKEFRRVNLGLSFLGHLGPQIRNGQFYKGLALILYAARRQGRARLGGSFTLPKRLSVRAGFLKISRGSHVINGFALRFVKGPGDHLCK